MPKSRIYIGQFQINIFKGDKSDLTIWTFTIQKNSVGAYYEMSYYVLDYDWVFLLIYSNNFYEFKLKYISLRLEII